MIYKTVQEVKTKRLDFNLESGVVTKDASGDCMIEGYANTSSKDRVGDVVKPTAFTKSLETYMKNPVLLVNHDWNDPCGVVTAAEVTDKGLMIKAKISNTREDIKTLIREGCLRTFSIGYNEVDSEYDESTKTKYVKELELLEISVVTVPANTEAMFTHTDAEKGGQGSGGARPGAGRKPRGGAKPSDSDKPKPEADKPLAGEDSMRSDVESFGKNLNKDLTSQGLRDAPIKVLGYSEPYTDSEGYEYPETLDVSIEARETLKYSLRGDGKFIPEGTPLSGKGKSMDDVKKEVIAMQQEWKDELDNRKSANTANIQIKSAQSLKDFIDIVHNVIGKDLKTNEVQAVCEYFINEKETLMTKEQLIALLKTKSVPATAAPAADAKADEAAPAAAQPQEADQFKELMAKIDAMAQAMAQILEAIQPKAQEPKEEEGKEQPKEDEEDKEESEEEMSDEEAEKQLAEIDSQL